MRGPHVFFRKLKTGPERQVVPYATVHSPADEASWCQGTGSRSGLGVNEDVAWNGVLAADLAGVLRTGTAGAMEASGGGGAGTQTPFPSGTPHAIPGTVEAEDYDIGGEGVAYHDTTPGNVKGGYRNDDVDIVDTGLGVRYIAENVAGEWLEYTVDVPTAGDYTLEMRVASDTGGGGNVHIEFDGVDKTGPIAIPDTGGWQNWTIVTRTVNLSAGQQIMRLMQDSVGGTGFVGNIDNISFTLIASSQSPYPSGTPHAIPGTIEAENYDIGGEGVAYHDTTAGNQKGGYRSDDVDIVAGIEGPYIAENPAGEWLEYTVDVLTAGTYTIEMRVASAVDGGTFHIEFDGVDKTAAVSIPNTGGWQTWTIVTRTVTLSAGLQIMRIVHDTNGAISVVGNIDYVRFTSGTLTGTILRDTGSVFPAALSRISPATPTTLITRAAARPPTIFEGSLDWADNYGTRIRGYVHPPATVNYVFWIASDDHSELWLSTMKIRPTKFVSPTSTAGPIHRSGRSSPRNELSRLASLPDEDTISKHYTRKV